MKNSNLINSMSNFLHGGYTVDDILAALQTAYDNDQEAKLIKAREQVRIAFHNYHKALGFDDTELPNETWSEMFDIYEKSMTFSDLLAEALNESKEETEDEWQEIDDPDIEELLNKILNHVETRDKEKEDNEEADDELKVRIKKIML